MILKNRILCFVLAAVVWGCAAGSTSSVEKTAGAFMTAYYVKADLQEASGLADGLALDKIKGSESLRQGLAVDAAAHQPKVRFKLVESRLGGEEAEYLYDVEFRPEKSDSVRKTVRLKVRLRDEQWKVTQFTDHDR